MLRIRVTDIDAFVRFMEPAYPEMETSLAQFIAWLRRESPETEEMHCGKAFHSVLERAQEGDYFDEIEQDGYTFRFAGNFRLPAAERREVLIQRIYQTPVGPVLVRGRMDACTDSTVDDYKLTFGSVNMETFADSLQWKAYLSMSGARRFRYRVFEASKVDSLVTVREMHTMTQWAYPEMGAEVKQRVNELAQFIVENMPEGVFAER